jgi:hypothetical protein
MFGMLLFNFVNYVFLLLCIFIIVMCSFVSLSILIVVNVPFCLFCVIVLFCVLFVYKCVLYYCHRVSTSIAVNKYIISIYPAHAMMAYIGVEMSSTHS